MQIFTVGEVAQLLKVPIYRLTYAISVSKVPQPRRTKLGARRFYVEEDLEEIRKVFITEEKGTKK